MPILSNIRSLALLGYSSTFLVNPTITFGTRVDDHSWPSTDVRSFPESQEDNHADALSTPRRALGTHTEREEPRTIQDALPGAVGRRSLPSQCVASCVDLYMDQYTCSLVNCDAYCAFQIPCDVCICQEPEEECDLQHQVQKRGWPSPNNDCIQVCEAQLGHKCAGMDCRYMAQNGIRCNACDIMKPHTKRDQLDSTTTDEAARFHSRDFKRSADQEKVESDEVIHIDKELEKSSAMTPSKAKGLADIWSALKRLFRAKQNKHANTNIKRLVPDGSTFEFEKWVPSNWYPFRKPKDKHKTSPMQSISPAAMETVAKETSVVSLPTNPSGDDAPASNTKREDLSTPVGDHTATGLHERGIADLQDPEQIGEEQLIEEELFDDSQDVHNVHEEPEHHDDIGSMQINQYRLKPIDTRYIQDAKVDEKGKRWFSIGMEIIRPGNSINKASRTDPTTSATKTSFVKRDVEKVHTPNGHKRSMVRLWMMKRPIFLTKSLRAYQQQNKNYDVEKTDTDSTSKSTSKDEAKISERGISSMEENDSVEHKRSTEDPEKTKRYIAPPWRRPKLRPALTPGTPKTYEQQEKTQDIEKINSDTSFSTSITQKDNTKISQRDYEPDGEEVRKIENFLDRRPNNEKRSPWWNFSIFPP